MLMNERAVLKKVVTLVVTLIPLSGYLMQRAREKSILLLMSKVTGQATILSLSLL